MLFPSPSLSLAPQNGQKTRKGQVNDAGPRCIPVSRGYSRFGADSSLPGYPLVGPPCQLAYAEIIADFFVSSGLENAIRI